MHRFTSEFGMGSGGSNALLSSGKLARCRSVLCIAYKNNTANVHQISGNERSYFTTLFGISIPLSNVSISPFLAHPALLLLQLKLVAALRRTQLSDL